MADAEHIVIEAVLDDILDPMMISDAVDEAVRLLMAAAEAGIDPIEQELAILDREHARSMAAIATRHQISDLDRSPTDGQATYPDVPVASVARRAA
jgi:hypothetical protein